MRQLPVVGAGLRSDPHHWELAPNLAPVEPGAAIASPERSHRG
jgi:hypothetical protein